MEIRLNPQVNIAEIWLSTADQKDAACMATLPSLIEDFKAKNQYPVVFRSGTDSLYDQTLGLLLHNRAADGDVDPK